ncbi:MULTISPECIES: DUF6895 family protein [unclassified Streptomyces]|uniref:DUF6895 family protein n=1 Tax=unclassified Streptomyces TaxID=2593676 RepID=UPI002DD87CA6|nr:MULTISPECIES: hypothetical protein [unclassified Streptomyces]WSB76571.1 hypothetical protein OHB04_12750 [Streptomyces sp. NBC_01775]WSS15142.1 hypothetical protein OG533_27105 [Streptomyces sp. NBC_01186]WSS43985.1 hypothetical protein OG220_27920 [Streptomyces sp. NBC_01187]
MTTIAPAPPALLHTVGDRALSWLDAHRDYFRLTEADRARGDALVERLKPIGELAINMRMLFREGVAGSRQRTRAGALLDFAWRELLDGGNVLAAHQHNEPFSPVSLEIYAAFHELDHRHPGLEAALELPRRSTTWQALEMPPCRRLGVLNAERRMGLTPSGDFARATAATWLGHRPEPWTVHLHTAYDITHTVFHLTNWGEDPGGLPEPLADYLRLYLPAWATDWAELEHWDLLGELLIVDACLPRPALDGELWERYAAAQSPTGAMPTWGQMPQGDPSDVFDTVHHPTLVAASASAMATSRSLSAGGT